MADTFVIKDKGKIYLGVRAFSFSNQETRNLESNFPIWKPKGTKNTNVICTGLISEALRIKYCDGIFEEDEDGNLTETFLMTTLIDNILNCLKDANVIDAKSDTWNCNLIISNKDRVFVMNDNFTIYEVEKYYGDTEFNERYEVIFDFLGDVDPIYKIAYAYFFIGEANFGIVDPLIILDVSQNKRYVLHRKDILKIIKNKGIKKGEQK